jgi:hypothetical protein
MTGFYLPLYGQQIVTSSLILSTAEFLLVSHRITNYNFKILKGGKPCVYKRYQEKESETKVFNSSIVYTSVELQN